MADTVKSALFVEYDSIFRRLGAANEEAAERLAERVSGWIAAIESDRLTSPKLGDGARRRILIRRCYADPALLGAGRAAFVSSGFEVVDCPVEEGRERNAAEVHLVLDAVDALGHPTGYDEFILLSADSDLSPLLRRLRAHNRTTAIYANEATTATYRAIADAFVDEEPLIALLTAKEVQAAAAPGDAPAAAAAPPADRSALETLARKIHAATNVPMFSPRTYADLFRAIAQEIAERGYHFQNTADNVSSKLAAAGRNVNRRQVLFVVKGLALKGHVFSTTDTPEKLAEVFREQVSYLIGNAGIELDEDEKKLIPAWIVGKAAAAPQPAPEPPKPIEEAKSPARRRTPQRPAPAKPAAPAPAAPAPAAAAAPAPRPAPPPQPAPRQAAQPAPAPAARAEKPAPKPQREPPREAPKPQPAAEAKREPAPPPPPPPAAEAPKSFVPRRLEEIRAAAAARLAAIGRPSPAMEKAAAKPAPKAQPAPPPPPPPQPSPAARAAPAAAAAAAAPAANQDPLESSILAAIAEAVDVLVEDGGDAPPKNAPPPPEAAAAPAPPPPPAPAEQQPEPVQSDGGDSDDIGDEIQRIIASYSRARQQD